MKSENKTFNFIDSQINPKHESNEFVLNTIKRNKDTPPKPIKFIRIDTRCYRYCDMIFSHPQIELIAKMYKDIHGTELDIDKLYLHGSK